MNAEKRGSFAVLSGTILGQTLPLRSGQALRLAGEASLRLGQATSVIKGSQLRSGQAIRLRWAADGLSPVKGPSAGERHHVQFPARPSALVRVPFIGRLSRYKKAKFVIGTGQTSPKDSMGYLGALAISDKTGIPIVEFPGDHAGMSSHPREFAATILGILTNKAGNSSSLRE